VKALLAGAGGMAIGTVSIASALAGNTQVILTIPNVSVAYHTMTITLSATATLADGSPVPTGLMQFECFGTSQSPAQRMNAVVTNGVASATFTLANPLAVGPHDVFGFFHGGPRY
jgi:hypothetical protein